MSTVSASTSLSGIGAGVIVPPVVSCLAPFVEAGVLEAGDVHTAAWLARSTGHGSDAVSLAIAVAVWAGRHGHTCVELGAIVPAVERELDASRGRNDSELPTSALVSSLPWPEPQVWRAALAACPQVVRTVDPKAAHDPMPVFDRSPLVLHGDTVFLQRHWIDESVVAQGIRSRCVDVAGSLSSSGSVLRDALLPVRDEDGVNLQRIAVDTALSNKVSLIVGGPGTGKTYTVARLLAVLLHDERERGQRVRIGLAAPTGKAAARMYESMRSAVNSEEFVAAVDESTRAELLDLVPTTIHRMLGPFADRRQRFRHDAAQTLPFDIVVIDETSMVPLPLMGRLLEALHGDTRLVLVGDPDQLESVELGAVLGDLAAVAEKEPTSPLSGRCVRLLRSRRFGGESPVASIANAIREPDPAGAEPGSGAENVLEACRATSTTPDEESATFLESANPTMVEAVTAVRQRVEPVLKAAASAASEGRASDALSELLKVRILCAHREGPYGVSHWNRLGETWMCGSSGDNGQWYPGRPLLATRNDPRTGLANGDTGVIVIHEGRPQAAFASASGVRYLDPLQLDDVATAFAMTVHKSQGSEYDTVVMILPPPHSPLVGRELLYTAVTRAKHHLLLVGQAETVVRAALTPARRMTGLRRALSA